MPLQPQRRLPEENQPTKKNTLLNPYIRPLSVHSKKSFINPKIKNIVQTRKMKPCGISGEVGELPRLDPLPHVAQSARVVIHAQNVVCGLLAKHARKKPLIYCASVFA
jgi:hypothetical protein